MNEDARAGADNRYGHFALPEDSSDIVGWVRQHGHVLVRRRCAYALVPACRVAVLRLVRRLGQPAANAGVQVAARVALA